MNENPRVPAEKQRNDEDWLGNLIDGALFSSVHHGAFLPILLFLAIPVLIVGRIAHIWATQSPSPYAIACLALAILGFASFSAAKFSLFRQGRFLTHGSHLMTPQYRRLYRTGYFLIMCSAGMTLLLIREYKLVEPEALDYVFPVLFTLYGISGVASVLWTVFVRGEYK